MFENKEIRNLKEGTLYNVIQILDINDDWKRFMSLIPMDPQKENSDRKYNNEHIRLIEDHAKDTGEKCAKILFEEWGTSGQIRPTLRTVQQIALQADMLRVADEIAGLLGENPPPRPQRGPGAPVTDNISALLNESSTEIRDTTAQMKSETNGNDNQQTQSTRQFNIPNFELLLQANGSSGHPQSNLSDNQLSGNNQLNTELSDNNQSNRQFSDNNQPNLPLFNNIQSNDQNFYNSRNEQPAQESNELQSDYGPPGFQVSLPNISIFQSTTENATLTSRIDKSILQDHNLIQFDYNELQNITSSFSDPHKIGTGGFGEVFIANHPDYGLLAIKKSHVQHQQEVAIKIFNSEVKYLSQFRHENIVPILGFSKNGPVPCIVCEFIEGGSLYGKIAEKVLNERQRINIMRGTAEGLRYLHSYIVDRSRPASATDPSTQNVSKTNFVHGDVKSANILLTKDFIPKLCDFGLAKQYDQTCITPNVMGTSVYMAPEALQGTVTQKSDIYSYGIVLLELLTGLRPLVAVNDPPNEKVQIKLYIYDGMKRHGKTVADFLDQSAGGWTMANEIFALAQKCFEYDRHDRPSGEDICNMLRAFEEK